MGQVKIYGKRQSGVAPIGDILIKYVYQGETINAGDLVEYINGVASTDIEMSEDTDLSNAMYDGETISAVQLDDNRVFIAHSYSGTSSLYGIVITINGVTITIGTNTMIANITNVSSAISAVKIDINKIFIAHSYGNSSQLYGVVVTINGTTITVGADTQIVSGSYSGMVISSVLLDGNRVFIAHSMGSTSQLYGIVVTIGGTAITAGTDTAINTYESAGSQVSAIKFDNNKVFLTYYYKRSSNTYYTYVAIYEISGTTMIIRANRIILENSSYKLTPVLLNNGNVLVVYSKSPALLCGKVCTIDSTTLSITVGNEYYINGYSYAATSDISAVLLQNGDVFISYGYGNYNGNNNCYYLYGVVVTVNGATITESTNIQISNIRYSGYAISLILLSDKNIFIAHSYNTSYALYGQVIAISNNMPTNQVPVPTYEQQVRKTTTPSFNGVAKTSGVGGSSTQHNEQVQIIAPTGGI